jgi:hypothetical protein
LRGEALDEAFACSISSVDSKLAIMSHHLMESIVSYLFDDFTAMRENLSLITKYGNEAQGHFSMAFVQTWLALFHYECYLNTGKRIHRRFARASHQRVHMWSKPGTEILHGLNLMLNSMAELCMSKSSSDDLIFSIEKAANGCHSGKCLLFEALAYTRLAKVLHKGDPSESDRYKIYQNKAVAVYRKWGAIALAAHVENSLCTTLQNC